MIDSKQNSFDSIDEQIAKLELERNLLLDKSLKSTDPESILKAQAYIKTQENRQENNFKSYLYAPEEVFYNSMGYKSTTKSITFDLMRKMSYTPIIYSIITTRVNQLMNFSRFTADLQKEGWAIRKKPSRFEDASSIKVTDKDKHEIDDIATFLENGGLYQKWQQSDDFDDFLRKQIIDSLTFDQSTFEIERSRNRKPYSYVSADASTMRLLNSIDSEDKESKDKYDIINGFLPIYAQVYNDRIVEKDINGIKEQAIFYPWELSFGVRNKNTDIRNNGYGKSELEILTDTISYQLFGMQYNGNFFKQGSNPRGFFTIDGNVSQSTLNEFRQAWRQQVSGFMNSHKTPVFEGKSIKVNWNEMGGSNKDMEFSNWNDYLILLACSVYAIDPSELGFNFQKQAQMFGQDGQKQRLEHSRDKGLKPLLIFLQQRINKYIVSELNPNFEFIWTGVDLDDESQILENDIKKVTNGLASMEDLFKKYSNRDFNPEKDTILNSVWVQLKQMQQRGGEESNDAVDEMTGESDEGVQNPFAEYEKADNPFTKALTGYIERELR